jgi:hypothetical protein
MPMFYSFSDNPIRSPFCGFLVMIRVDASGYFWLLSSDLSAREIMVLF